MIFTPLATDDQVRDPAQRLYVYPFGPYPMLGGVSSTTGSCLVWAYEKLGRGKDQSKSFEEWVQESLAIEPGAEGLCFLPYLAGERSPYWSDTILGGFYGLRLSHSQCHVGRAVMEGVAYSLRHLLDIYDELGIKIDQVALAGGGTATQGWSQILADVCQLDVSIYAGKETVTRVLYALCQVHLGRRSLEAGLLQTFDESAIIRCRRELGPVYDRGYQQYRAFAQFAWEQAQVRT
jgi:xylulokinase